MLDSAGVHRDDSEGNQVSVARPVRDAVELAELETQLEAMIKEHGYVETVRLIDHAWFDRACTWDAYQQMINVAHNINERSK